MIMSKVIILGDLHLGARNNSQHFAAFFNKFFTNVLYPYMKKNSITEIIQLGDLFDNRTSLAYRTFFDSKKVWFDYMVDNGIKMHVLLGNHDILHKHSLEINAPELLLQSYENINIIKTPKVLNVGGVDFDIVPWMCDENKEQIKTFMSRDDRSSVCLGHFEISGFPMYKGGTESTDGEPVSMFDRYSQVISGHYHTSSERGNIIYSGVPYEISWSDYGDQKYFLVYDTETNNIEWVKNPLTMFEKIYYNDKLKVDYSNYSGKIVKVIVNEKKDPVLFERFVDSLKVASPFMLDIIDAQDFSLNTELRDDLDVTDTKGICDNYIDGIETNVDKELLKSYINELYIEAQTLDDRI